LRYFVETTANVSQKYYLLQDNSDKMWRVYLDKGIHGTYSFDNYMSSEPPKEVTHEELLEWIEKNWQ